MPWNKVKRLFIEETIEDVVEEPDSAALSKSTASPTPARAVQSTQASARPTTKTASSRVTAAAFTHPEGKVAPVPPGTDVQKLNASIDFQGLYDRAKIPNTDEVEQLEKFLSGLDESTPQTSRVVAAKAFLGAVGKSSADVITDAGRKIEVVRAINLAKINDTTQRKSEMQRDIDRLQAEVEKCKRTMLAVTTEQEQVEAQCKNEEMRLQTARLFFGQLAIESTNA